MERHQHWCLSKAYLILRNEGDAEEEVQNAFAKAWKNLWQFQGQGSFAGWLSRIVFNECMMRIRDRKGARLTSVDQVIEKDGNYHLEVVDQRPHPEEELGDRQVSRVLQMEIRRIPPLLRAPLIMRDLHRMPMSSVAAQLGISVPAAKSRLMRARKELRIRLAKHQGLKGCGTLLKGAGGPRTAYVRAM